MTLWRRHHDTARPEPQAPEEDEHTLTERAPRPIWLPQLAEPVSLVLRSGEKLPGRVLERSVETLLVAVVVPVRTSTQKRMRSLVLEYSNPGGRVSLSGEVSLQSAEEGLLVRIDEPQLVGVQEERAHIRVQVECPITLRASAETVPIHTHTEDLSGGGALLGTAEPLEVGDRVEVQLTLEPGEHPIGGVAEVVRLDSRGHAGIQFVELSTYERWRLIHFTVECQSREDFRHHDL